jgi:hypothetical protein
VQVCILSCRYLYWSFQWLKLIAVLLHRGSKAFSKMLKHPFTSVSRPFSHNSHNNQDWFRKYN